MSTDSTRARTEIWLVVILFAWVATACGEADGANDVTKEQVAQTVSEPTPGADGESESAATTLVADAGRSEPEEVTEPEGDTEPSQDDILATILEGDLGPLEIAEGPDLTVGGSPNTSAAAAIAKGLEEAGVALDGITLSVLPVSGMVASLLVLEVGDEYLEEALIGTEEGSDMTGVLLALPEMESASVAEVVTIYRGEDEIGPFTMTFTVSVEALRQAYESDSELGDELVVELERAS